MTEMYFYFAMEARRCPSCVSPFGIDVLV